MPQTAHPFKDGTTGNSQTIENNHRDHGDKKIDYEFIDLDDGNNQNYKIRLLSHEP